FGLGRPNPSPKRERGACLHPSLTLRALGRLVGGPGVRPHGGAGEVILGAHACASAGEGRSSPPAALYRPRPGGPHARPGGRPGRRPAASGTRCRYLPRPAPEKPRTPRAPPPCRSRTQTTNRPRSRVVTGRASRNSHTPCDTSRNRGASSAPAGTPSAAKLAL